MSAALVGVAFGGEKVVVKLGREGQKSVEGSSAMFVVCVVVGVCVIHDEQLPECTTACCSASASCWHPLAHDCRILHGHHMKRSGVQSERARVFCACVRGACRRCSSRRAGSDTDGALDGRLPRP
jgi:hypothetical protein